MSQVTLKIEVPPGGHVPEMGVDHTDLQLRIYQAGSHEFATVVYPRPGGAPVEVVVALHKLPVPRIMLWAVVREKAPGGRVVYQTLGVGIVPLENGRFIASVDDPSQRDSQTERYEPQGTLMVGVKVAGTVPIPSAEMDVFIDALLARALDERESRYQMFQSDLSRRALVPAAAPMYLRTFTTAFGIVPASYFAAVSEGDPPPRHDFVSDLWQGAAALHDTTREVMEANIQTLFAGRLSDTDLFRTLVVFGEALSLVGTSCWYNGDHHGGTPVERFAFGSGQRLNQCDCEDCAQDIFAFATRAQSLDPASPEARDAGISGFLRLLRQYAFFMVTGVATTPSMQRHRGKESGGNVNDYICHVWTVAIPKLTMYRLSGESRYQSGITGGTSVAQRLADWRMLLLEGTNFTTDAYRSLPSYIKDDPESARELAAKTRESMAFRMQWEKEIPALRGLSFTLMPPRLVKRPDPQDPGSQSNFYRWALHLFGVAGDGEPIEYSLMQRDGRFGITMQQLIELEVDEISVLPRGVPVLDPLERAIVLAGQPPRVPFVPLRPLASVQELWRQLGFRESKPSASASGAKEVRFRFQHVGEIRGAVLAGLKTLARRPDVEGAHIVAVRITDDLQVVEIHVTVASGARVTDVMAVAMLGSKE